MMSDRWQSETIDDVLAKKARRKAVTGGSIKPRTLVGNLVHQGFFYLDRTERWMRVAWGLLPSAGLYVLLAPHAGGMARRIGVAGGLLAFVHVLNWIFNHNFWNCINSSFPGLRNRGASATRNYLASLRDRLRPHPSISALMLLGSISRLEWHSRSDIDLRVLRRPGFWNGVSASLLVSRERLLAVLARQPLDVYLADTPAFLRRRRKDEQPLFLLKRDARLDPADFPSEAVDAIPELTPISRDP